MLRKNARAKEEEEEEAVVDQSQDHKYVLLCLQTRRYMIDINYFYIRRAMAMGQGRSMKGDLTSVRMILMMSTLEEEQETGRGLEETKLGIEAETKIGYVY